MLKYPIKSFLPRRHNNTMQLHRQNSSCWDSFAGVSTCVWVRTHISKRCKTGRKSQWTNFEPVLVTRGDKSAQTVSSTLLCIFKCFLPSHELEDFMTEFMPYCTYVWLHQCLIHRWRNVGISRHECTSARLVWAWQRTKKTIRGVIELG